MVVIGWKAAAIEAFDTAARRGAKTDHMIARHAQWMIPHNAVGSAILAVFRKSFLLRIPSMLLWPFFCRGPGDLDSYLFGSEILKMMVADGTAKIVLGDARLLAGVGLVMNRRRLGMAKDEPGDHLSLDADVCIMATGYSRAPQLVLESGNSDALDLGAAAMNREPQKLFLQTFPPEPAVATINTYVLLLSPLERWLT